MKVLVCTCMRKDFEQQQAHKLSFLHTNKGKEQQASAYGIGKHSQAGRGLEWDYKKQKSMIEQQMKQT